MTGHEFINLEASMGHTAITCRRCGTMSAVENESLEAMREFRCPVCNMRMTDHEFIRLKFHYYVILLDLCNQAFGSKVLEFFDYHIVVNPKRELQGGEEL